MERDGRQGQARDAHVLHNQDIYPDAVEVVYQPLRLRQFLVFQDGVHRDVDAHPVDMGILHQAGYVFQ